MPPSFRAATLLAAVALTASAATVPSPLNVSMQKAAAEMAAGGMVSGESRDHTVHFDLAGRPAPRPELAPEKIIFEIGSISKVFTALLLAQTVLDGKADLHDPIAKFLPASLELDPRVAAITLEQLATHTSGLPRLPTNFAPANPADPYADYGEKQLDAFLGSFHPAAAAPQPAEYSNLGFGLLGHLLERIHGQPYATLLAARITGPLGLPDTVIDLSEQQQSRFATPYSGAEKMSPWHFAALAGCGAIRSTAADLVKFGEALLAPDSPIHAAWELVRQPRADFGGGTQIGLAMLSAPVDGHVLYNHAGGTGGFRSFLEISPDSQQVTVLLENNDAPEPGAVVAATRPRPPAAPDTRAVVPLARGQLAEYTGVYALDPKRRFTAIVGTDDLLHLRLTGQPFLPVVALGNDRFLNRNVAAEFQFVRGADGKIASVTLYQRGREIPAPRTADAAPTLLFPEPAQLQAYIGRFQLAPGAVFEITARGGQLFAKLTGQQSLPVFCDMPDHFVYDVVDAALTFERDPTGVVTAVILHQNGRDQRAARVPAGS